MQEKSARNSEILTCRHKSGMKDLGMQKEKKWPNPRQSKVRVINPFEH